MPFLTADALTTDAEGMAFLRDVLSTPGAPEAGPIILDRMPSIIERRARRRSECKSMEPISGKGPVVRPMAEAT